MTSHRLQTAFFLSLLALTTVAFFGLIQDLLLPIFWAVVLATLFYPVFGSCERTLGGRAALASVMTITLILLLVILPVLLTGFAVGSEVAGLYEQIAAGTLGPQRVVEWIERNAPTAVDALSQAGLDIDQLRAQLSGATVATTRYLATEALAFGQNALRLAGLTLLMLYLLFFFLRDGAALLDVIVRAVPIDEERQQRLLGKFAEVARATIKGTLVIGLVQGTIGGVLFALLGIDGAVLWGVVMGLLSLLPAVGAALVWIPAATLLLVTGSLLKGIVLLFGGTLLIGLADNVLRPLLVGRDTQMPDYLILLTTLGGLTLFGLSGVVIGPVVAALFLAVWAMFAEEYAGADDTDALLSPDDATASSPTP
jgi:predicted PurR-regulated permease PerM